MNEESNTSIDDEIKPSLRIGISLGEVIMADNTVTGAGVILAQRLEQLAEPGGVMVQGSVAETVPARMPFEFEYLGEHELKGFDQQVRAFSARLRTGEELPQPDEKTSLQSAELRSLDGLSKPSIAVLPFTNLSGDQHQDYFADGITRDIISTLSRFKNMRVVSHHSVLQYKRQKASIGEIANEQKVRYILDGSIRTSVDRIRVNAELIDSQTNENCWVDQYDRNLTEIFTVQDDITKNIAVAMQVRFSGGERDRLRAKGTINIKAWGLCVMADDLLDEYKRENLIEARRMVEEAIELDPGYCYAGVVKGWVHWEEAYCGWGDDFDSSLAESEKASVQALKIDPNIAEGWSLTSLIHMLKQEPSASIETGRKAVELEPGNAEAHALLAVAFVYGSQYDNAWVAYEKSLELSPICPAHYLIVGSDVCLFRGQTDEAIKLLQHCVDLEPNSPLGRFYLVNALLENGEESKARFVADEIREIDSTFRIAGLLREYSHDGRMRSRLKANLGKMGFVE